MVNLHRCILIHMLFLLVIDWIMKTTTEGSRTGIQWSLLSQLHDLDFADDIALLSHNHKHAQDSPITGHNILVPRGRAPFGHHQESRPLAWSNTGSPRFTDFPSLCACSESSLTNLIGSGLNLLCFQSHSKTECRWTGPEVPQRSNECACLRRARARGNGLHHFHRNKQRQNGGRFKFPGMCFISRG